MRLVGAKRLLIILMRLMILWCERLLVVGSGRNQLLHNELDVHLNHCLTYSLSFVDNL